MGFGFDQPQIDDVMNMMAELSPEELDKLLADGQQGVDNDELLDYTKACVSQSKDGFKDRRKKWDQLWQAHECEIPTFIVEPAQGFWRVFREWLASLSASSGQPEEAS